jgi:hypothetical protein
MWQPTKQRTHSRPVVLGYSLQQRWRIKQRQPIANRVDRRALILGQRLECQVKLLQQSPSPY